MFAMGQAIQSVQFPLQEVRRMFSMGQAIQGVQFPRGDLPQMVIFWILTPWSLVRGHVLEVATASFFCNVNISN